MRISLWSFNGSKIFENLYKAATLYI
jgi:hypothetical protein